MREVGSTNSITDFFIEIKEKGPKVQEHTKILGKSVVQAGLLSVNAKDLLNMQPTSPRLSIKYH